MYFRGSVMKSLRELRKHHHFNEYLGIASLAVLGFVFLFFQGTPNLGSVDVHEHIASMEKAALLLEANRSVGIDRTVIIPSPTETLTLNGQASFTGYRDNVNLILDIAQKHPDHFIPFCTVSPLDADALEFVKDCVRRGGKGVKLYNGHSYYYEIFGLPLDGAEMIPIYQFAQENHLPLLFHVNIGFYMSELEVILSKFPKLVVAAPHYMVSSTNLKRVRSLLERYPHLYTDISFGSEPFLAAGLRRVSASAEEFKELIEDFPDRFLFGADMVLTGTDHKGEEFMESTLRCYRDGLEKEEYNCPRISDYYKKEMEKYIAGAATCTDRSTDFCREQVEKRDEFEDWYRESKVLKGLNLSEGVLKQIYEKNPARFLSGR